MTDAENKKLESIEQQLEEIKSFIMSRDSVTNLEYCTHKKIAKPTLLGWFKRGCPREDSRHVSIKAVDEWARSNNTRKPKG